MKARIAILLSSLITACSWGPPNLSGVLRESPGDGEVAVVSIHQIEAEQAWDYKYIGPGRGDGLMEYRNLNFFHGMAIASPNIFAAPYMNWFIIDPGAAVGVKSRRAYLAVYGSVHLIKDGELGFDGEWGWQAGYKPAEWITLVMDQYRSVAFDWEKIEEPGAYAILRDEVVSARRQYVFRVSPVVQLPGMPVSLFPSAMYGLEAGNWGVGVSLLLGGTRKIKSSGLSGPPKPVPHPPYY
jgi:hypothetical protein